MPVEDKPKNEIFIQEHADITGCKIFLPKEKEAVLLGTAILAAVASGRFQTVMEAMKAMSRVGEIVSPNSAVQRYHETKYKIFHHMYKHFLEIRQLSEKL